MPQAHRKSPQKASPPSQHTPQMGSHLQAVCERDQRSIMRVPPRVPHPMELLLHPRMEDSTNLNIACAVVANDKTSADSR
jgi:hypothetical protein